MEKRQKCRGLRTDFECLEIEIEISCDIVYIIYYLVFKFSCLKLNTNTTYKVRDQLKVMLKTKILM